MKFDKILSFGYPQYTIDPSLFYKYLKNSPRYRAEIRDIYFSQPYVYEFNGQKRMFGDVMGASSDPLHLEYLLKIQNEFGIPISLTFNETYPAPELCDDPHVLGGFIDHIGKFYEMGIRSCTLSHVHLMALGKLQRYFPEMRWKNTVNHIITKPQQVVDYYNLGYDIINLDRSLNRDMDALNSMQPLRKKYGDKLELSLLVTEGCMPNCPFKVEHDTMQKVPNWNYWQHHGQVTCGVWRNTQTNELPRIGTDIVWADSDTFYQYLDKVDYFKFSGRLGNFGVNENAENEMFTWSILKKDHNKRYNGSSWKLSDIREEDYCVAECLQDVVENNLGPVSSWQFGRVINKNYDCNSSWSRLDSVLEGDIWTTKKGKTLNKVLMNCKNECWDCHACERVFGVDDFDSLIEVDRDVSYLKGHIDHFKGIPIIQEL